MEKSIDQSPNAPVSAETPQGPVRAFDEVLVLLEIDALDVDEWLMDLAVDGTNRMLEENGLAWFKRHRILMIDQLKYLGTF